jgi:hypothetical protein
MNPGPDRWYGWLLRLYPRHYRRERGPEMLATMLDARESGQPHRAGREVAGLVLGALRMRAGAATGVSPGQLWMSAVRLAVLFLLAQGTAASLTHAGLVVQRLVTGQPEGISALGYAAATTAGALAVAAVAHGRYLVGVLGAAAGLVAMQWAQLPVWLPVHSWLLFDTSFHDSWPFPLAILLALPLLVRRPGRAPNRTAPDRTAPRRPLAWLLAVPLAVLLLPTSYDATLHWQPGALYVVAAGCLLWTVVDARAPIAGAALVFVSALPLVVVDVISTTYDSAGKVTHALLYAGLRDLAVAVVLVGIGALRIARQARL